MRTVLLILGLTACCLACIWDSDTIDDEIRGIPNRARLVSNRWYRHGEAYYQERIDRLAPKASKTLDDLDDLAVAYQHLDRFDEALHTLDEKAALLKEHPNRDHLYRYYANRGTVMAHSKHYKEALEDLEKALEINPDAHFGREKYQLMGMKYALAASSDPSLRTRESFLSHAGDPSTDPTLFHDVEPSFEHTHFPRRAAPDKVQLQATFEAVAGLLRFGGREGAELYRVLADISLAQGDLNTAWYFYQVALVKKHPASQRIEDVIRHIENHWDHASPEVRPTRAHFLRVWKNSEAWLEVFHEGERLALKNGEDPGDPVVLYRLIEEADREVPELPFTPEPESKSSPELWLVGLLVLLVVIPNLRARF